MLRPVPMSLLTIYLNQDLISMFLEDIIKIRDFHIKKIEPQKENTSNKDKDSSQGIASKISMITPIQRKKYDDQMILIHNYINELINYTHFKEDNNKVSKQKVKLEIEFDTLENTIENLLHLTEEVYMKIKEVSKEMEDIDQNLEDYSEIASLLNVIAKFGGNYNLGDFQRLKFSIFTTNREHYIDLRHAINQLNSPVIIYGEDIGPNTFGFFLFYEKVYEKQMSELLLTYNCHLMDIPTRYFDDKGVHINLLTEDHHSALERRNYLSQKYNQIVNELQNQLNGYFEIYENLSNLVKISKEFTNTPSHMIVKIEGFVPTKIEQEVIKAFQDQFRSNIKITSEQIPRTNPYAEEKSEKENTQDKQRNEIEYEIKKTEIIKPPTLIKLNRVVKPLQTLTDLYGVTNYSEVDPNFLILVTFPIIFGLMFGDVGHGFTLIIVGIIGILKYRNGSQGIRNFSWIILFCGMGAIFGGILYGESWGGLFYIGDTHIILYYSPLENVNAVLKLSIYVGVCVMVLGYIVKFINLWINHMKFYALAEPLVKIIILLGGTYLILTYKFDIDLWLGPPYPILLVILPSLFIVVIKAFGKGLHVASYLKNKKAFGLIGESTLDLVETMLQIISNVASFVRILALEMVHVGFMMVINELQKMAGGSLFATIIILIAGNTIVIVLEFLIVFIHAMRLHFYEFFSKFYCADGTKFEPIVLKDNYSVLKFKHSPLCEAEFNYKGTFISN